MEYPVLIENEQHLNRLISEIANYTAVKTAEAVLMKFGKISQYMKKSECIRLSTERKINKALQNRELKYVVKGRNIMILRSDFNAWQQRHTFVNPHAMNFLHSLAAVFFTVVGISAIVTAIDNAPLGVILLGAAIILVISIVRKPKSGLHDFGSGFGK